MAAILVHFCKSFLILNEVGDRCLTEGMAIAEDLLPQPAETALYNNNYNIMMSILYVVLCSIYVGFLINSYNTRNILI